jgi:GNAT superfamily N-acetyltransferase
MEAADLTCLPIRFFPRGTLLGMLLDAYADVPAVIASDRTDWDAFDSFFHDFPEIADRCGFVTVAGDTPVGFASWDPRELPDRVRIGHNCIIRKDRGQGFGRRQMEIAVHRILESHPAEIVVSTGASPFYLPARRMYLAAGFRETRRFSRDHPDADMVEYTLVPGGITP